MDQDSPYKYSAKCTWDSKEKDIRNSISFGSASERFDSELTSLVQVETCVSLLRPEGEPNAPCSLHITLEDPLARISNVAIVSEAKVLELYGLHGEYIKTVTTENLDNTGGVLINWAQTEITPVPELLIKFAGIKKGVDQLWVYGIRLIVDKAPMQSSASKVNYQNVEERLRSSKIPITEKAERCKRFLEQYTTITNSCAGIKSPDSMSGSGTLGLPQEVIVSQLKAMSDEMLSNCLSKLEKKTIAEEGPNKTDVSELKEYIDSGLLKLESRILDHFNKHFNELNRNISSSHRELESRVLDHCNKQFNELKEIIVDTHSQYSSIYTLNLQKYLNEVEVRQNKKLDSVMSLTRANIFTPLEPADNESRLLVDDSSFTRGTCSCGACPICFYAECDI